MTRRTWNAVDDYIAEELLPDDPALEAALEANRNNELPTIDVSPAQGKLLNLLIRMNKAKRILEIGTLGGYSTIWMARALPTDGKIVTLEIDPHHAKVARANIKRAGLSKLVDLRVGPALDSLSKLSVEGGGPFDLIFIDADKEGTPGYFQWAVKLARQGALIVVDNVVREGAILDTSGKDSSVQGMRRFFELAATDPRVSGTALQTVGAKGHDGLAILLVTAGR